MTKPPTRQGILLSLEASQERNQGLHAPTLARAAATMVMSVGQVTVLRIYDLVYVSGVRN